MNGEGVFGLRRSFVISGAQTLVMSLWQVPAKATKELMVQFYNKLLDKDSLLGRAEALRQAQLVIKSMKEYDDPLYWGAFICQGNVHPLSMKYNTV